MQIRNFKSIAAAVAVSSLFAVSTFAARGQADFTRFVALGDSYGAGVSSIALNIRHQRNSWPAVIARQVGLNTDCIGFDAPDCFQIPYVSEPGILPELELKSLIPLNIALKPGLGSPLNSALARPYNNMSVDGAEVGDLVKGLSGDGNEGINGQIVVRGLGAPADQVLRLNPTFIAVWIGGNDGFNGATSGRGAMTSVADFTRDYNALLDKLTAGAPSAGIVVGNLPTNIAKVPYTNTIPAIVVDANRQPVRDQAGNFIPLIANINGTPGALPPGSLVTLAALGLLQTGVGIPGALKPLLPNLPNVGQPLPDEVTITPTEAAEINQRLTDFNAAIAQAASSRNIPVADINGLLNRFSAGTFVGPLKFDLSYITGGIVSLDGYHLTDIGYTLFANEYIRTINRAYNTQIPLASITNFFQNNDPSSEGNALMFNGTSMLIDSLPQFSAEAAAALAGRVNVVTEPEK